MFVEGRLNGNEIRFMSLQEIEAGLETMFDNTADADSETMCLIGNALEIVRATNVICRTGDRFESIAAWGQIRSRK